MELLVVIVIVVILSSAMIPIMSAASDSRRLREGARLVNTQLASAQSRATSSGRACGVLFQRMKNNANASVELYLVEVPPPYSGDDAGYTAVIQNTNGTSATATIANGQAQPTFGGLLINQQVMIRPGDLIRFNYRGQLYLVNYNDTTNPYLRSTTFQITPTDPSASYPPSTPQGSAGVPFQIFRQPIKTVDPPVQLTDGAAVDLTVSGIDLVPPNSTTTTTASVLGTLGITADSPPLVVMFSPTGTLEQVYYNANGANAQMRPIAGVYLMVGKSNQIPVVGVPRDYTLAGSPPPNYMDSDCRWVAITRQSGLVVTTEVAQVAGAKPPNGTITSTDIQNIMRSRRFASGNQASSGQ